jgi:hypothetical protein
MMDLAGGATCLTSSRSSFGGDVEMAQDEVSAQLSNTSKGTRSLTQAQWVKAFLTPAVSSPIDDHERILRRALRTWRMIRTMTNAILYRGRMKMLYSMWMKRLRVVTQSAEAWIQRILSWNPTWTTMTIWREAASG